MSFTVICMVYVTTVICVYMNNKPLRIYFVNDKKYSELACVQYIRLFFIQNHTRVEHIENIIHKYFELSYVNST